jgi:hypothetical protein
MERLVKLGYCTSRRLGTANNSPVQYELTAHGRETVDTARAAA